MSGNICMNWLDNSKECKFQADGIMSENSCMNNGLTSKKEVKSVAVVKLLA